MGGAWSVSLRRRDAGYRAMGKGGQRRQGLSLIEVLVVLAIASLLLTALLPITSRAIATNVRLADRGLSTVDFGIEEMLLRRLLAQAAPLPGKDGGPARTNVEGDGERLVLLSDPAGPIGCAEPGGLSPVTLRIEPLGRGGRLVCESGSGQTEVLRWAAGVGRFRYSEDGQAWSKGFTAPDPLAAVRNLDEAPGAPLVAAPLVRFSIEGGDGSQIAWIERVGRPVPVRFSPEELAGIDEPRAARFIP